MSPTLLVALVLALSVLAYRLGQRRAHALAVRPTGRRLHSRPGYHGLLAALWCAVPALCIIIGWQFAAGPVLTSLALDTVATNVSTLIPAAAAGRALAAARMAHAFVWHLKKTGKATSPPDWAACWRYTKPLLPRPPSASPI